jgi:GNAT superfamily N-acetyltransferase
LLFWAGHFIDLTNLPNKKPLCYDYKGGGSMEFCIRPIGISELDQVADKCWDDRPTQQRLLEKQEILGFGAWDERDICIASLHCYRVWLPQWDDEDFPGYARKRLEDWPLGWPLLAAREKGLAFDQPVWGISCFHVGVLPGTYEDDPAYSHRGIGTALLEAAVSWGKQHGYAAIIAIGGPKEIPAYNVMQGSLPWTSYAKLGFDSIALEEEGLRLPWWVTLRGEAIADEVRKAMAKGTALEEICARLMMLKL